MTEIEKAQLRLSCVIEAGKLKETQTTTEEYKDKDVVEIAEQIAVFVLGN